MNLKIVRTICLAILCAVITNSSSAQTPGSNARTAMGAPTGSYTTDELERINYFNGGLHFELPLLKIEGRGEAEHAVMLTIDPVYPGVGKTCPNCPGFFPLWAAKMEYEVGYGPGVLEAVVEARETFEDCFPNIYNDVTRTFLKFKGSDGTEYSLYDVLHDGQSLPNLDQCVTDPRAALRGQVFGTRDGSSATFISDVDIYDLRFLSGPEARYFPSGVLKLRDGTWYRIDNGVVTTLTDRNGNRISYEYFAAVSPGNGFLACELSRSVKKKTL